MELWPLRRLQFRSLFRAVHKGFILLRVRFGFLMTQNTPIFPEQ